MRAHRRAHRVRDARRYTRFVEGVGFVRLFLGCQLAQAALSLLDVLLVSRRTLGVPDHLFVLGTDALGTVLSRMTMQVSSRRPPRMPQLHAPLQSASCCERGPDLAPTLAL